MASSSRCRRTPPSDAALLRCLEVDVSVPGRRLVAKLTLEARAGRFIAVLGRNGAGKTLTLHTLAGLRRPDSGRIELDGRFLDEWRPAARARRVGLLPQSIEDPFPATVLETALIGRHPHIELWRWEEAADVDVARAALAAVDLGGWEARQVDTLSGGERRRLAIAQVLTQSPGIYLLDEPTNHLDPQHQLDVLHIFVRKARGGAAVVTSLHDVNLAARFADKCLLLYGDGRWELDETSAVLTEKRLTELYATSMEMVDWRDKHLFIAAAPQNS